jgi:hypothetical protein
MRRQLAWRGRPKDKAVDIRCPGEEQRSSPGRDLRELALPWVFLSMIDDLLRGKALAGRRDGGVAC